MTTVTKKIKLGTRPKSFPHTVKFPMLDGTIGTIGVDFKYRTRSEHAEFIDRRLQAARAALDEEAAARKEATRKAADDPDAPAELFSVKEHLEKTSATNVDYVMEVVEGWNLDIPFDREAVEQLADELPAAMSAIIETYGAAINEGRLGN